MWCSLMSATSNECSPSWADVKEDQVDSRSFAAARRCSALTYFESNSSADMLAKA